MGSGKIGTAYKALNAQTQRHVVIKKLRDEIANTPSSRASFIREAGIVATLNHDHIVRVLETLDTPEGVFLVQELAEGVTLDRVIEAGQEPLAREDAMAIMKPVAEAIDYAHSRGILHRDLKLSNIIVSGEGVVKVMDFSLPRLVVDLFARQGHHGFSAGFTQAYLAPEEKNGLGESTKESDIYALGVCFYEMLAGQKPFGDNVDGMKRD